MTSIYGGLTVKNHRSMPMADQETAAYPCGRQSLIPGETWRTLEAADCLLQGTYDDANNPEQPEECGSRRRGMRHSARPLRTNCKKAVENRKVLSHLRNQSSSEATDSQ